MPSIAVMDVKSTVFLLKGCCMVTNLLVQEEMKRKRREKTKKKLNTRHCFCLKSK